MLNRYGFTNVITPADILAAYPTIWPFSQNFAPYYDSFARPLPKAIYDPERPDLPNSLKIDAVFVFHDPRDWARDTQLILDLLLSHRGYLGTLSTCNSNSLLPNQGYQQDGQPPLYFSNPDLLWAAAYHLPRLGQGGFREAFEGVWGAMTGGEEKGVSLQKRMCGKPYEITYAFAEKKLESHRPAIIGPAAARQRLKRVYMVGGKLERPGSAAPYLVVFSLTSGVDNPESDIRGANEYTSPQGSEWQSILVRSGVYNGGEPTWKPTACVGGVWDAVKWGLKSSGWQMPESS